MLTCPPRYRAAQHKELLNGFSTALSSWLLLAGPGKSHIGGARGGNRGQRKSPSTDICSNLMPDIKYDRCSSPAFENRLRTRPAIDVWNNFKATEKWCGVMKMLQTFPRDAKSFNGGDTSPSQEIAQYLKYSNSPNFICGKKAEPACTTTTTCSDSLDAPSMLILDSVVHLSDVRMSPNLWTLKNS
jgi:hypothetical protein